MTFELTEQDRRRIERFKYAELEVAEQRANRIGSYVTRATSYGALASVLLSLGQCTRSCVGYYEDVKGLRDQPGSVMMTNEAFRTNDLNTEGADNNFTYRLNKDDPFIAERPELLAAVESAQKETAEARVASKKAYEAFQATPEYNAWFAAQEKSSAQFMGGVGILLGGVLGSGLLAMLGHGMNERKRERKRTEINRAYGKE